MSTDKQLLEELRRIDELERKAAGGATGTPPPTVSAAQDVSGQTQGGAAIPTPTSGAANAPDSRGGYRRRSGDNPEGHLPFSEGALPAALNVPASMLHGFKQLVGADVPEDVIKHDRELIDRPGGGLGDFVGG